MSESFAPPGRQTRHGSPDHTAWKGDVGAPHPQRRSVTAGRHGYARRVVATGMAHTLSANRSLHGGKRDSAARPNRHIIRMGETRQREAVRLPTAYGR